jgi:hypothetical protein
VSKNTHILASQNHYLADIREAAAGDGNTDWTCPKNAEEGDGVYFHVQTHGLVAQGVVDSHLGPADSFPNRYAAGIREVRMLPVAVPLSLILAKMPDFGWARYPRSYVSLRKEEAAELEAIVQGVDRGNLRHEGRGAPLWLNVDKPCKTLVIHTLNGCSDERRKGYGRFKPVGKIGKDGGWLPFDNILEAVDFGRRHWSRYGAPKYCSNCANAVPLADLGDDEDEKGAEEGTRKLRMHLEIERDQNVVKRKRLWALKTTGKLECEVCEFDFVKVYGPLGKDFCEVHHRVPLHELRKGEKRNTKLEDLAVVCSNCHRMLHRGRPACYKVDALKVLIEGLK